MSMRSMSDLNRVLIRAIEKLEKNEIDPQQATALARLGAVIIAGKKLEMDAEENGFSKQLVDPEKAEFIVAPNGAQNKIGHRVYNPPEPRKRP